MKVTEDMLTEGGGQLIKLADFIGLDDTGIQVIISQDMIKIIMDSFAYPNKSGWFTADDAEGIADLLKAKAAELRELYGS